MGFDTPLANRWILRIVKHTWKVVDSSQQDLYLPEVSFNTLK